MKHQQGSSYAGRGRPGGTGAPGTFAGKFFFFYILLIFFLRNDFFIMKRAKVFFFKGGDTPSLFPNPLCLFKVATAYTRVHNPSRSLNVAMLAPFRQLTTRLSNCTS